MKVNTLNKFIVFSFLFLFPFSLFSMIYTPFPSLINVSAGIEIETAMASSTNGSLNFFAGLKVPFSLTPVIGFPSFNFFGGVNGKYYFIEFEEAFGFFIGAEAGISIILNPVLYIQSLVEWDLLYALSPGLEGGGSFVLSENIFLEMAGTVSYNFFCRINGFAGFYTFVTASGSVSFIWKI